MLFLSLNLIVEVSFSQCALQSYCWPWFFICDPCSDPRIELSVTMCHELITRYYCGRCRHMSGRSTSKTEFCTSARAARRICRPMGDVEEVWEESSCSTCRRYQKYVQGDTISVQDPTGRTLQQPSDPSSQFSEPWSSTTTFHTAATSLRTEALENNVDNEGIMREDERAHRGRVGKPDRSSGLENTGARKGFGPHQHCPPHILSASRPQFDSFKLGDHVTLDDRHHDFDPNDMREAIARSLQEIKTTEGDRTGQDQKITALELELKIVKEQLQLERERREPDRQKFELEKETARNKPLRAGRSEPEVAKVLEPDINYSAPRGRELWIGEIRRVNGRNVGRERRLEVGEYVVCRRKGRREEQVRGRK